MTNYKIIKFDKSYMEKVIDLLSITFSEVSKNDYFNKEYFLWKHINNPFGESIMLIAIDDTDNVIAFRSFMKWIFLCPDGTKKYAYRPVDSAVHPRYQSYGLFKKLTFALLESNEVLESDFIFNTPNKNSYPIYTKETWGWKKDRSVKFVIYPSSFSLLPSKITYAFIDKDCLKKNASDDKLKSVIKSSLVDFNWRYVNNPVINYLYLKDQFENILILRLNKRTFFNELLLVDVISKSYNDQINISIAALKANIKFHYLLLTRDLKNRVNISDSFPIYPPKPYFSIITRNTDTELSSIGIEFSIRDLELF